MLLDIVLDNELDINNVVNNMINRLEDLIQFNNKIDQVTRIEDFKTIS